MHIVTRRHLREVAEKFADAAREIEAWVTVVEAARWQSFRDIKAYFPHADSVDGYVVFNIRRNRYRLITVLHYAKMETGGHVYVRSFLTHKQYDDRSNWDRKFGTK